MTEHPPTDGPEFDPEKFDPEKFDPDKFDADEFDADEFDADEFDADEIQAGDLARLSALHRTLTPADHDFVAPPAAVWERIVAAIGETPSAEAAASSPSTSDAEPDRPAPPPTPLRSARTRRSGRPRHWLAAAAATLLVVALAGGAFLASRTDRSGRTELASAQLSNAGLDPRGAGASGTATLVRKADGTYLDLHLVDPPSPTDGYLEVWLIDTAVKGMVSLGPFRGNGAYLVPEGVDAARYPIVDVSDEPLDGLPTHSGISVLRGDLA